jgi:outer membrane protein assembly factor BamE (lipoprotein component of BamABCDE complex)
MRKRILAVAIYATLSACVSSGTKVTQQQLTKFEVGKTTEADVIAALGAPNNSTIATDGSKIDVYAHVSARANAASYVPIVGLFAGSATAHTDSVTLTFDPTGLLKAVSSSTGQTTVNTGLANQQ